jgi:uncharacterized protein YacL (UPF0231 family)
MINIKFYRDEEGYFKADTEPEYQLLSKYLQSEIQGVAAVCAEILAMIQEIEVGDRLQVEGIGNAYGLKLTTKTANIWSEYTETELSLELPIADFKQALESCYKFCDRF